MTPFATILVRPRETIRSILARPQSRTIVLLVLLAAVSALIRDVRLQAYRSLSAAAVMPSGWHIAAGCVAFLIAALLLSYAFALLAWGIARLLGGTADRRAVRVALAWSLVPLIWALLYRIPVALFWPAIATGLNPPENPLAILRSLAASMSLYAVASTAVIALLTIAVDLWCFVIASVALSEVNGFSTWRGAATVGFSLLAPVIVVAAFFIARAV